MALTVVTPAGTNHLTTLAHARTALKADSDAISDDDLLDLIDRASSSIASECRRVFGVERVTETLDGTGSRLLGVVRRPVVLVHEVLEDSSDITSDVSIEDRDAGALYRRDGWGRSGGSRMWGVEAFSSGYILPGLADLRYTITYTAGYILPPYQSPFLLDLPPGTPNLPGAVEQACLETVKTWYQELGEDLRVSSIQVDDVKIAYSRSSSAADAMALPPIALSLLRPWRSGAFDR